MSMLYKLDSIVQEEGDDNNVTFRLYGTNIPVKEALTNADDNTTTIVIGHKLPDSVSSNNNNNNNNNSNNNITDVIDNRDERSSSSSSSTTTSESSSSSDNCNGRNYEVNFDTTVSASVILSKKRSISSSKVTDGDHVQTSYFDCTFVSTTFTLQKDEFGQIFDFSKH
ncbi:unnamed protein product [Litomosoides sigmodontis]|uniref:Uncharacterized protein n=1 Tax=Litomosoides sigmodontis TaxID=42156 RepID=A0A3P6TM55_LITSI|nr:unnamed protein product [Litomosoides sigmodontis]